MCAAMLTLQICIQRYFVYNLCQFSHSILFYSLLLCMTKQPNILKWDEIVCHYISLARTKWRVGMKKQKIIQMNVYRCWETCVPFLAACDGRRSLLVQLTQKHGIQISCLSLQFFVYAESRKWNKGFMLNLSIARYNTKLHPPTTATIRIQMKMYRRREESALHTFPEW